MIQMKNIYYAYDSGATALKNVSVQINAGESVDFIGPNGSGKSTLMKLINGLVSPSSVSYSFEGLEITSKKLQDNLFLKTFHKKVGFIFQNSEVQLFLLKCI
jgi:cobalt/nickel transport system ATP-binding protein